MTRQVRAIAFMGSRVVLRADGGTLRLPDFEELAQLLGSDHLDAARLPVTIRSPSGLPTEAFGLPDELELPAGFRLDGLRVAYHGLSEEEFRAAGTARQKLEWYRTHQFCSRCGARNDLDDAHEAMLCPRCGQRHFPRVAPAVIVLVQRDREALLGRSARFPEGVYSTLAGFVEPGESLEECVHREIHEEAGVRVTNLRYFGSQPHPFPHSLMVGFVADWLDGDIRVDPAELEDARWFEADRLPDLPHPFSIARALIEDFARRTTS